VEEIFSKLIWILTYSSVIASEKESTETAVIQANEAVTRYNRAWNAKEGS
jgi:hypothetical protein